MNLSRYDTSINVCRMRHKTIIQLIPQTSVIKIFIGVII